jgi:hypothetical protein
VATGPEHYAEAERLLTLVESGGAEFLGASQLTAEAQVHATLALAAVHAYGLPSGEWQETVSRDKRARDDRDRDES